MGECGGGEGSHWALWVMGSRLFGLQDDPIFLFPLPGSFSCSSPTSLFCSTSLAYRLTPAAILRFLLHFLMFYLTLVCSGNLFSKLRAISYCPYSFGTVDNIVLREPSLDLYLSG